VSTVRKPRHIQSASLYPAHVYLAICAMGTLLSLSGCATPQGRRAAETEAINRQAAQEIERMCALHGAARDAELKKLKQQSGFELYCPKD
jgi:hypothetical protein